MHLIGGTIPQGLMQALPIIKLEVTPNPLLCLCNTLIVMQVNFLLLHRAPEPFDNYIIQRSPTPIPADTDLFRFQGRDPVPTGKLLPLLGIEKLRAPLVERGPKRRQAKCHIQRHGKRPGHHIAAIPVQNSHEIDKPPRHPNISNVCTPYLIGPVNQKPFEQIGIACLPS